MPLIITRQRGTAVREGTERSRGCGHADGQQPSLVTGGKVHAEAAAFHLMDLRRPEVAARPGRQPALPVEHRAGEAPLSQVSERWIAKLPPVVATNQLPLTRIAPGSGQFPRSTGFVYVRLLFFMAAQSIVDVKPIPAAPSSAITVVKLVAASRWKMTAI